MIYSVRVEDPSTVDTIFLSVPIAERGSVKRITQETGGEIFESDRLGSIEAAMQAVVSRLKLRFTLGYQSTNTKRDGTFRRINVHLADRLPLNSGFTVYSRRGYYAAKSGMEAVRTKSADPPPPVEQSLPSMSRLPAAANQTRAPSRSFTNEDIMKLAKAGFGEEAIFEAIRANDCHFDTSASALLALENEGINEKIIHAMLAVRRVPAGAPAPRMKGDSFPERSGIYLVQNGEFIPLEPDTVEWRSDFFAGTTTLGKRTTTPLRVSLDTGQSALQLSYRPEFLLLCPAGGSEIEYYLLRAEDNGKSRESRTV